MITENMKKFIEAADFAYVASADAAGTPHIASARGVRIIDSRHLLFESWFCRTTLENLGRNNKVAVAVIDAASGTGYQFMGTMSEITEAGVLDGYSPDQEETDVPQVCWCLKLQVDKILAFSHGVHGDTPLSPE